MVASALSDREMVRSPRGPRSEATPQDSGRLRALELLGRASGAFVELTAEVDVRSSADLLAELDAMLDSAAADDTLTEDFPDRPDTMDIH